MIQAVTNLNTSSNDSIYGYQVDIINTSVYTHNFIKMLFKDDEFQANDIYSILVRDSYYSIDSIGV